MGKSSPKAPAAPDPAATAAAQTQSNKDTALYNFGLNNPNYNTPLGSINYTIANSTPQYDTSAFNTAYENWAQNDTSARNSYNSNIGKEGYTSGGYKSSDAPTLAQFKTADSNPQSTANVTLSPDQQKLFDAQTAQSQGLSDLATQLQGRVGSTLNQPLPTADDINALSQQASDAYYKNQTRYLDPQYQQGQQQLDAKLANQGITMGSEAYNNDQNNFARQKQSAYDTAQQNAILQGPQNASQLFSLNSAERSQPLNEFNSLRTGSQVQMPTFGAFNPVSAAGTNTAGIAQQGYQNSLNGYNQQIASNNNTTSGLFGLAGSLGSAYAGSSAGSAALTALFASDRRLKTNIEPIGKTKGGVPVYRFKYKGADQKYIGVMSDEVRHIPGAVHRMSNGFDAVDYSRVS